MNIEEAMNKGLVGSNTKVFADKATLHMPQLNLIMKDSKLNGGTVNYSDQIRTQSYLMINDPELVTSLSKKLGYEIAVKMHLNFSEETPCIFILPKKSQKSLVRIDFNPKKIGVSGMMELAANLNFLMDDFWKVLMHCGYLTRIDCTVDVWGIQIEQVWATHKQMLSSMKISKSGKLQTLYFGSLQKPHAIIYDKLEELGIASEGLPITRIEQKWMGSMMLKHLHALENPFNNFAILPALPPSPLWAKPWRWHQFCNTVKLCGPMAALAGMPNHDRKKYRDHLKNNSIVFWNPEQIWAGWSEIAHQIQTAGEFVDAKAVAA
jgi:hypothetical protein